MSDTNSEVTEHEAEAKRIAEWMSQIAANHTERDILYRAAMNIYRLGRNHMALEFMQEEAAKARQVAA